MSLQVCIRLLISFVALKAALSGEMNVSVRVLSDGSSCSSLTVEALKRRC